MQKVFMAIGAHADDIELNVGGTLLKYKDKGYRIVYVMATNNMSGGWSKIQPDGSVRVDTPGTLEMMKQRKMESAKGAALLGTVPVHLDHPQRHYNGDVKTNNTVCWGRHCAELRYGSSLPEGVPVDVPTIVTAYEDDKSCDTLADLILQHNPEWIVTHGLVQQDIEHIGTALLVLNSYRIAKKRGYRGGLLFWRERHTYLGETNIKCDVYVDITEYIEKKIDLISVHKCQIPFPRRPGFFPIVSNKMWGKSVGCGAAEVYAIVSSGEGTTSLS
ncbi:PIG-L family deacetylase [bacterium]|nr:PIG-L family deacetylase [bacterium]